MLAVTSELSAKRSVPWVAEGRLVSVSETTVPSTSPPGIAAVKIPVTSSVPVRLILAGKVGASLVPVTLTVKVLALVKPAVSFMV